MTDHFIGLNRGTQSQAAGSGQDNLFTYGTSTGSTDVEIRIADAAGWTREELTEAIEAIENFLQGPSVITGTKFPPG